MKRRNIWNHHPVTFIPKYTTGNWRGTRSCNATFWWKSGHIKGLWSPSLSLNIHNVALGGYHEYSYESSPWKSKDCLLNGFSQKNIILVGIWFINNSRVENHLNGRFDLQGSCWRKKFVKTDVPERVGCCFHENYWRVWPLKIIAWFRWRLGPSWGLLCRTVFVVSFKGCRWFKRKHNPWALPTNTVNGGFLVVNRVPFIKMRTDYCEEMCFQVYRHTCSHQLQVFLQVLTTEDVHFSTLSEEAARSVQKKTTSFTWESYDYPKMWCFVPGTLNNHL